MGGKCAVKVIFKQLIEEAVVLYKKYYERMLKKKKSFIDFINESPFKALELDLKRDCSPDRDTEL